jgi:hypothetical protein
LLSPCILLLLPLHVPFVWLSAPKCCIAGQHTAPAAWSVAKRNATCT